MDQKQLLKALSEDPEAGGWFWPEGNPDHGRRHINEVLDYYDSDEPFCVSRNIALSDIWVVPVETGAGFKAFHTEEDARAFLATLRKSEETPSA